MMKNLTWLRLTDDDVEEIKKDFSALLIADQTKYKKISCIVVPTIGTTPTMVKFWSDFIYEFKIDYYKTGVFDNNGFFEYAKIEYDPINNNYRCYSYYKYQGKWNPTAPTRKGEYDVIEFIPEHGIPIFKGPIFTEGFRKGSYDEWILNTSLMIKC